MNQCGYQVHRRRDVTSTYINVESMLSVCWEQTKINYTRTKTNNSKAIMEMWSARGRTSNDAQGAK